ncbi:MAG TPA: M2 family metallopeptidase [Longimicrobiales bacterium]|nr:M2 family metallopeptidase [Longimicrobiales bacterium]
MSRSLPARLFAAAFVTLLLWNCSTRAAPEVVTLSPAAVRPSVTAADARAFVDSAEATLLRLQLEANRAQWLQETFITYDTEQLAAQANERVTAATVSFATQSARFNGLDLPYDVARKIQIIRSRLTAPAPADASKNAELARILAELSSMYGRGEYCAPGGRCIDLQEMTTILAESRNADSLLLVWTGWRTVAPPMKAHYQRFVELSNEGARALGFADLGAMWRSNYDMPPDDFAREVDRLWEQVRPLYVALHCHVRARLGEKYGFDLVSRSGPIPAQLLGNMWAQQWGNIYELVAPPAADPGYVLTERLRAQNLDARAMTRYGERFFTSLGLAPLPQTFWERSQFTQPADRDVVCHASAWDLDEVDDVRIKMCIAITGEDFRVIHHELGHNFYQRAYNRQPFLYRNSANDGFHEALGDAVALSITPEYLQRVGLIERVPPAAADLGLLMRDALDKIAFLPFGLLVDQWRWQVFSGEVSPQQYNAAWWQLRERYQGVRAPVARSESDFDPGAKFHVPANVPYTRYFLAHILQFQFHRALCQAAGQTGPLHRCTIYDNREAGRRLNAMMELGMSRPWPEALQALTGSPQMDATAILDYFAPLRAWLDEQNRGRQCGW